MQLFPMLLFLLFIRNNYTNITAAVLFCFHLQNLALSFLFCTYTTSFHSAAEADTRMVVGPQKKKENLKRIVFVASAPIATNTDYRRTILTSVAQEKSTVATNGIGLAFEILIQYH